MQIYDAADAESRLGANGFEVELTQSSGAAH